LRSATLRLLNSLSSEYGILLVLVLVCGVFSALTVTTQAPEGADGGARLAREVIARTVPGGRVVIVVRATEKDAAFADALRARLEGAGRTVVHEVRGTPADVREALEGLSNRREVVYGDRGAPGNGEQAVSGNPREKYPGLGDPAVLAPSSSTWPTFLTSTNLLNNRESNCRDRHPRHRHDDGDHHGRCRSLRREPDGAFHRSSRRCSSARWRGRN